MPKNQSNVMYYGVAALALIGAYYYYTSQNKKKVKKKIKPISDKDKFYNILIESIDKSKKILKYDTEIDYDHIKDRYNIFYKTYSKQKINIKINAIDAVLRYLYREAIKNLDANLAVIYDVAQGVELIILSDQKLINPKAKKIVITNEIINLAKEFAKASVAIEARKIK